MEFVEGHTLGSGCTRAPRARALEVVTAAGRGLAAANERDPCHSDFQDQNVMIGADGHVRVRDFRPGCRSTASGK